MCSAEKQMTDEEELEQPLNQKWQEEKTTCEGRAWTLFMNQSIHDMQIAGDWTLWTGKTSLNPTLLKKTWNVKRFIQNSQTLLPTDTTWEALIHRSLIISQKLHYNQSTTTEKLTNTSPDDTANWEANCCRAQIYMPLQILGNNRADVSQLNSKWGNKVRLKICTHGTKLEINGFFGVSGWFLFLLHWPSIELLPEYWQVTQKKQNILQTRGQKFHFRNLDNLLGHILVNITVSVKNPPPVWGWGEKN